MNQDLIQIASNAAEKNKPYAFATIIQATLKGTPRKSGAKMIVFEDGSSAGSIGGGRNEKAAIKECVKAIKSGESNLVTYDYFGQKGQSVCGGQMSVFIEPHRPQRTFILCGAGHIGLPLSIMAKMLNFKVILVDNRRKYANKTRFAHVDKIYVGPHAAILKKLTINENTYIMIVTQGNEYDFTCLKTVIKSQAAYIGVISSKTKRIKFTKRLKEEHKIEAKYIKNIDIPAGIDIGAQTPEEIAVAISAKLISLINKDNIGTAKFIK